MTITEKTAYLKGLLEGMNIDETKAEGKLFKAVIETLDELANDLTDVAEDVAPLNDYVEELDEDLGAVEEFVYSDDECDCCDCDDDDFDCDGDCDCCDEDCDGFYEVECPHCGANVCFDETCDPREILCPSCQEKFDCLEAPDAE